MSENGQLLADLLERENLCLLNAAEICQGAITRNRVTNCGEEKAILDYIITCDQLAVYLDKMKIDDERNYCLTKYATTKVVKKIVKSDHNILYARFGLQYKNMLSKMQRKEVFNLKNPECQLKFTEVMQQAENSQILFRDDPSV